MTTAIKTGAIDWAYLFYLGDKGGEGYTNIIDVRTSYKRIPNAINLFCKYFVDRKGRDKEKTIVRPSVKKAMIDLCHFLSGYGNSIIRHKKRGIPLEYEITGLEIEMCSSFLQECSLAHPGKMIEADVALIGMMLKEFYLTLDKRFWPDDFRRVCNWWEEDDIEIDPFYLGLAIVNDWGKEIRESKETNVIGYIEDDIISFS